MARFAHIADCHLGAWRIPILRDINHNAFSMAIDRIIKADVDFVIIAGDLFNNALPSLESLRHAVTQLKRLRDKGLQTYVVPGSHDCVASGGSILDVLESADLLRNVVRGKSIDGKLRLTPTIDKKTGIKIFGLLGKRAGLEKEYYHDLDRHALEAEQGEKIFIFHGMIAELKEKEFAQANAMPLSLFPRGCDYYAGGHVHRRSTDVCEGYGMVAYPGPTFPNTFSEIEELKRGGFIIVDGDTVEFVDIEPHPCVCIDLDCTGLTAEDVIPKLDEMIATQKIKGAIVTMRVHGDLTAGRIVDIRFNDLMRKLEERGAVITLRNTSGLLTPEFQEVKVAQGSVEDMEERMISEHAGGWRALDAEKEAARIKTLMNLFATEKPEGHTLAQYETLLHKAADKELKNSQATAAQEQGCPQDK